MEPKIDTIDEDWDIDSPDDTVYGSDSGFYANPNTYEDVSILKKYPHKLGTARSLWAINQILNEIDADITTLWSTVIYPYVQDMRYQKILDKFEYLPERDMSGIDAFRNFMYKKNPAILKIKAEQRVLIQSLNR